MRIRLLSLEGAKFFNPCFVASMHLSRSNLNSADVLIITVLISLKDGRASIMVYKQTSLLTLSLKKKKRKDRTWKLRSWAAISKTRKLGTALIIPVKKLC